VSTEFGQLKGAFGTAGEIIVGVGVDATNAERVPQQLDQLAVTLSGRGECQVTEKRQTFLGRSRQVQLVRASLTTVVRAIARGAHRRLVAAVAAVILAVAISVDRHASAVPARQLGQPASAAATAASSSSAAPAAPPCATPYANAVRRVSDQQ